MSKRGPILGWTIGQLDNSGSYSFQVLCNLCCTLEAPFVGCAVCQARAAVGNNHKHGWVLGLGFRV